MRLVILLQFRANIEPNYTSEGHRNEVVAMLTALQRRLDEPLIGDSDQERRYFSKSIKYLRTASGRQTEEQDWMVSSIDVDISFYPIAMGGL